MKPKKPKRPKRPSFTTVSNIPCWAAEYFVNANKADLPKEDVRLCEDYAAKLLKDSGLRLVCPIEGTRNEFCGCPAFGLGCDVEDYTAERVPYSRVVFRKCRKAGHGRPPVVAFLPDEPSRPGWVRTFKEGWLCTVELSMSYYYELKPCGDAAEYAGLADELFRRGFRVKPVSRIVRHNWSMPGKEAS